MMLAHVTRSSAPPPPEEVGHSTLEEVGHPMAYWVTRRFGTLGCRLRGLLAQRTKSSDEVHYAVAFGSRRVYDYQNLAGPAGPAGGSLMRTRTPSVFTTALLLWAIPAQAGEGPWGDLMRGAGPRGGGVIVDHQPVGHGGLASDTAFRLTEWDPAIWQRVADDILLGAAATVGRVRFWGFYNDDVQPVGDETMRVRFYGSRAGDQMPGTVLFEQSFLNPGRTATGVIIPTFGAPAEFVFDVSLSVPVSLDAGVKYWLEIVQVGDEDSTFRWEYSQNTLLNGHVGINEAVEDWRPIQNLVSNAAFQLLTVPEPTSAVSVMILLGLLGVKRRKRTMRATH